MTAKPWHGRVGTDGCTVAALSIANFHPLADVGIHALVAAMAFVEALVEEVFPRDAKYSRVEWLTVCVILPRADIETLSHAISHVIGRLSANHLEVEPGVWVEVHLVTGIASSRVFSVEKWNLVEGAVAEAERSRESLPMGWSGDSVAPLHDYEAPHYL